MESILPGTLTIVDKYIPDQGRRLEQEVGPRAITLVKEMVTIILDRVREIDPRTAQQYPENPAGYKAPLADSLAELLDTDPAFAQNLADLLRQYEQARQAYAPPTARAGLSGSGVVTQGATQTAGERGVVGSSAGGSIITGDGNVVGEVTIRDSTGVGLGAGQQVTVTQGVSGESLADLFAVIYRQIEAKTDLPPAERADLKAEVVDMEAELEDKTDPVELNESFLASRLRNIERMAPDILDTIATTAISPVAGLKGVWDKIVAKAREIKAAREAK